jgi:hypothetical protein
LKPEAANFCGSLKDRTAHSLLDDLEQRGLLERGSVLRAHGDRCDPIRSSAEIDSAA